MHNKDTIAKIVKVLSSLNLMKMYIFGSQAKRSSRPGSDYDICIILSREIDKNNFLDEAYKKMWELRIPTDLLVFYEDEFLAQMYSVNTIPNEVVNTGQVIYAA